MGVLFNELLFRPLYNALIVLYQVIPGQDLGVAIILLTILVRLVLSPLLTRQFRSQAKLAALQPKVDELRKTTKDQAEQSRRLMGLYREHGVSPVGGCLPLLIQLPILWAMYQALQRGLQPESLSALYAFVASPGTVDPIAFGFLNLAEPSFRRGAPVSWPGVILAVLTGLVTYWQVRQTPIARPKHTMQEDRSPAEQMAHRMSTQMRLMVPATTVYFTLVFPVGIALYWFVTTIVAVLQQHFLLRRLAPRALAGKSAS